MRNQVSYEPDENECDEDPGKDGVVAVDLNISTWRDMSWSLTPSHDVNADTEKDGGDDEETGEPNKVVESYSNGESCNTEDEFEHS